MEIEIITKENPAYPALLKGIKNPPPQLYCCGDCTLLGNRSVAVVGSRTSTVYGRKTAAAISRRLAASGVTVVSGMALGADSMALTGALDAGGAVAAVLGSGVDIV